MYPQLYQIIVGEVLADLFGDFFCLATEILVFLISTAEERIRTFVQIVFQFADRFKQISNRVVRIIVDQSRQTIEKITVKRINIVIILFDFYFMFLHSSRLDRSSGG